MKVFIEPGDKNKPQLERAAKLLRVGNRFQASSILAAYLNAYPEDEQAWHMLRYALDDQKQVVGEMQRRLEHDADDQQAKAWLSRLASPFEEELPVRVQLEMREQAKPEPPPLEHISTDSLKDQGAKRRKILVTGDLSNLAITIAQIFSRERDKVVLAAADTEFLEQGVDNLASIHTIDLADDLFRGVLSSYNFDVIIYLATREEQITELTSAHSGKMLDGLSNALQLARSSKVKRFIYLSSTEVYGDMESPSETVKPQPKSINGHALYAGEQYCQLFNRDFNLNTVIIRVPYVYGPNEKDTLLYDAIQAYKNGEEFVFPGKEDELCNFLHAEDIVDFIHRVILETYTSHSQVINLSSIEQMTYRQLAQLLSAFLSEMEYRFNQSGAVFTQPVAVTTAKDVFDWVAERRFQAELPRVLDTVLHETVEKETFVERIQKTIKGYRGLIKWLELILGAVLMEFLVQVTGTLLQFKLVDFRLLFVVLMGSLHGSQFGLLASLIASLSGLFSWYRLGFDWALLIYNIENWLPFAMYFIAGAITGYVRDKYENEIEFKEEEVALLHEKYSFLYGVYDEINELKDHFRQRLMGYRDSFGRIFNVTRVLDTLQEDEIFFRALGILEDIMSNENVAIYTIDKNVNYARLEVSSRQLRNTIEKSVKLVDFPRLIEHLQTGEVFQNEELLPNYPAYFAPILQDDKPVAAVVLWDAKFEQYSLYYYNLFQVLCGLIQSSLVRATIYLESNIDKTHIISTKILEPDAFLDILEIKRRMKRSKVSDYQVLNVQPGDRPITDFSAIISKCIRATDFIGAVDGQYYVLLSQADKQSIELVISRLEDVGIKSELADL